MIRLAATVMLVRPSGGRGFEVLMVRRSGASHFVPHAYVFPGGTVDDADYSERTSARLFGAEDARLEPHFRMAEPVSHRDRRALAAAALRELYEEAGVLLACDASGDPVFAEVEATREPFLDALESRSAFGDVRRLSLFSHWITPPSYPRRYDTHFFLAVAGAEQHASADAVETHDGVWIAPQRALDDCAAERFSLVYPTIKHLERLAAFDSCDALLRFTRGKPIRTVVPKRPTPSEFALPEEVEASW